MTIKHAIMYFHSFCLSVHIEPSNITLKLLAIQILIL